jgi:hypothetical protein
LALLVTSCELVKQATSPTLPSSLVSGHQERQRFALPPAELGLFEARPAAGTTQKSLSFL